MRSQHPQKAKGEAELLRWELQRQNDEIQNLKHALQEELERLRLCEADSEEMYRLRNELRRRTDEVQELQRSLQDAQQQVLAERQHVLDVTMDNDALRLQELEDRRKIQHLLAVTQPVIQETTRFRKSVPEKVTKPSRPQSAGAPQTRVLRTVFMPNEQVDTLMLTVEALRAQLDEQARLAQERIASLQEERHVMREAFHIQIAALQKENSHIAEQLRKREDQLHKSTREYLSVRYQSQVAEKALREDNEQLTTENRKLHDDLERLKFRVHMEKRAISARTAAHQDELSDYLRKQCKVASMKKGRKAYTKA